MMGKRSTFERRERDFYPTPAEAIIPLLPHLAPGTRFCEPCAGDGALIRYLEKAGHICIEASDLEPQASGIIRRTFFDIEATTADCFITNPPWPRVLLHALIEQLAVIKPTWLLFDADWQHTRQAVPYLPRLRRIVSVGRIKWIPDSKMTGKDNCAWHLFDKPQDEPAAFYGRLAA